MSFDTPPATAIAQLHATLVRRDTPEAVAELIGRVLTPSLARRLEAPIGARVAASVKRLFGWTVIDMRLAPRLFGSNGRITRYSKSVRS